MRDERGPADKKKWAVPDRPRLRPLEAIPVERDGIASYCLRDPSGESEEILILSPAAMALAARLDGSRDLGDLQAELCRKTGEILPRASLLEMIESLDVAGFLDSERFRERRREQAEAFARAPLRPVAFAGESYPADPELLGPWIDECVGAKLPIARSGIRALLAPHIDPERGAAVYGSAYRALPTDAPERIVLLGISHAGGELPFAVLDKGYDTAFGPCEVDGAFIAALCDRLPFDPRAGAALHRKEHSLEFQTLFLRRLLAGWDRRRIVPILCCFPYSPPGGPALPYPDSWRTAFTERLAGLLDRSTLLVLGVDFAHVGRRFGDDPGGVEPMRKAIEREDRRMMEILAGGDLGGFQAMLDSELDARRICGYPALRTLLEVSGGMEGEALDYGQAVDPSIDSLVSFGAMVFR